MIKPVALVFLMLMSACTGRGIVPAQPAGPVVPAAADDTCRAGQYATLVGQDATALERVLLLGQVRVIRPGMAVTMDFRPERINFDVGPDNRITRIFCS